MTEVLSAAAAGLCKERGVWQLEVAGSAECAWLVPASPSVCGTEFKGPDRKPNRNRTCDRIANGIQNAWSYFPKEAANCCSRPAASEYAISLKLDFAVTHGAQVRFDVYDSTFKELDRCVIKMVQTYMSVKSDLNLVDTHDNWHHSCA